MKKSEDACTIVIFRGANAPPLRFSFPAAVVKRAKILGMCLLIVQGLFLTHYVIQTSQVWELNVLREEMVTLREQTTAFSNSLDDLKRRMLTMKEVNHRLRIMLGIEEQKADMLNGRGGSEQPMDAGVAIGGSETVPDAGSLADKQPTDSQQTSGKTLVAKVQQDITWLQYHTMIEERTLEQLIEAAKDKSARWAATPSIWPIRGWVTSGFGPRISPFTNQLAMHDGLDISAAPNNPVQAPAGGRVVSAGFDAKMGNVILIDHGYGIETEYGHLAKLLVRQGQRVKRGDVIALIGSTGLSTGPHLHYMVKVRGQVVNPRNYLLD